MWEILKQIVHFDTTKQGFPFTIIYDQPIEFIYDQPIEHKGVSLYHYFTQGVC
jgi:hypothetical protein